jgi:hypothetical protein
MKALLIALITTVLLLSSHARAQEAACFPAAQIAQALLNGHQETPTGLGVAAGGNLMVLYTSPEGSWTVVVENPSGIACLAASGEGWQAVEAEQEPSL